MSERNDINATVHNLGGLNSSFPHFLSLLALFAPALSDLGGMKRAVPHCDSGTLAGGTVNACLNHEVRI